MTPRPPPPPPLAVQVPRFDKSKTAGGFNVFAMMYAPFVVVVDMDGAVITGRALPRNSALWGLKWVNSSTIVGLLVTWTTYAERWESASPYLLNWETGVEEVYRFRIPWLHRDIDYNPLTQRWCLCLCLCPCLCLCLFLCPCPCLPLCLCLRRCVCSCPCLCPCVCVALCMCSCCCVCLSPPPSVPERSSNAW